MGKLCAGLESMPAPSALLQLNLQGPPITNQNKHDHHYTCHWCRQQNGPCPGCLFEQPSPNVHQPDEALFNWSVDASDKNDADWINVALLITSCFRSFIRRFGWVTCIGDDWDAQASGMAQSGQFAIIAWLCWCNFMSTRANNRCGPSHRISGNVSKCPVPVSARCIYGHVMIPSFDYRMQVGSCWGEETGGSSAWIAAIAMPPTARYLRTSFSHKQCSVKPIYLWVLDLSCVYAKCPWLSHSMMTSVAGNALEDKHVQLICGSLMQTMQIEKLDLRGSFVPCNYKRFEDSSSR